MITKEIQPEQGEVETEETGGIEEETLLTVKEVAKILKYHPNTVYELVGKGEKNGGLASMRLTETSKILIPIASLNALIKRRIL